MKKLYCLLLFMACFSFGHTQVWLWGSEAVPSPFGIGDELGDHQVAVDNSGNAFITGLLFGHLTFGAFPLSSPGVTQTYVVKYSPSGTVLWAKQGSWPNNSTGSEGRSIAVDGAGNCYVIGNMLDSVSFAPFKLGEISANSNAFLVKYDPNGNVLWARQDVQNSSQCRTQGISVVVDVSGNAYITGSFIDTVSFGPFMLTSPNSTMYIAKYDPNGNVLWAKQAIIASGSSSSQSNSIALDVSGNTYLTGAFRDTISFGAVTLRSTSNLFLVKYDPNGNVLWAEDGLLPSDFSSAYGVTVSVDGTKTPYLVGTFVDTLVFGNDTVIENPNVNNFIARFSTAGNILWIKQLVPLDNNAWNIVSVGSDTLKKGGCYLMSYAWIARGPYKLEFGTDTFSLATNYQSAGAIIQIDSAGTPLCGTIFTEGNEDDGDAVGLDRSGKYVYVTGDLWNQTIFGPDTLTYGQDISYAARWVSCANNVEAYITSVNDSCNGSCDGQATAYPVGGKAPYTYLWSNASTLQTATGLCIGAYSVMVSDANGHQDSLTVSITQPTALTASIIQVGNIKCNGSNTGTATVSASGGTAGYSYAWSTVPLQQTNAMATGLSVGSYTVTVKDAHHCPATATVTITQPPPLRDSISGHTNPLCHGNNNGKITGLATGGAGAYTYLWAPVGGNTAMLTGLSAACYTLTVIDANGCSATVSYCLTQPNVLSLTASTQTQIICNGAGTASDTAKGAGGTGAYTFSWNTAPIQNSATATGLSPGSYIVTITDSNGCSNTASVNITQPPALSVSVSNPVNVLCNGDNNGSALANGAGGTSPYTYKWKTSPPQNNANATGLSAGTYTVLVTDAHGCKDSITQVITQPLAALSVTATSKDAKCGNDNGTTNVIANGGTTSYTYSWQPGGATNASVTGVTAGTYTVTVTDANGCIQTAAVTVNAVGGIVAHTCCDTTIQNGGSAPLIASPKGRYKWLPSTGLNCDTCPNPIASPTITTWYVVTVTDSVGCTSTDSVLVKVETPCSDFYVPNVFTPNDDGVNDDFVVKVQNASSYSIVIYDRWGKEMYSSTDVNAYWNGTINATGYLVPDGVYYYIIKTSCSSNSYIKKGFVTVLGEK